jgi:hypothetical protein
MNLLFSAEMFSDKCLSTLLEQICINNFTQTYMNDRAITYVWTKL